MAWIKHFRKVPTANAGYTAMPQPLNDRASQSTSSKTASYLPEVYAGHPSRLQRYFQYDDMDKDSDINAALDTIADFCTQSEEQNDMPFIVHYNEESTDEQVKILQVSLRKWTKLNDFKSRLWYMVRNSIKNGDTFFLRDPETYEWLTIDHNKVEMVKVDNEKGKDPTEYFVRGLDYNKSAKFATKMADMNDLRTPFGSNVGGGGGGRAGGVSGTSNAGPSSFALAGAGSSQQGGAMDTLQAVDARHVVHLSLSVGDDINWPFGASILEAVFKTFKQKELLEDSIIIYRVQRAPERRIFYIDVGSMPPQRAKAHIEQIKNEIHQRRMPNRTAGGGNIMDTTYAPLGILEDYFIAQCLSLTSKINTLAGGILTLQQLIDDHEAGIENWVYSINLNTQKMEPGRISWAGVTRKNAEMVRVTLDNGEHVDTTPDHRFILRDGSECEAQHLTPDTSLMPLYLHASRTGPNQKGSEYVRYTCNATGKKRFVHSDICPKPPGKEYVIHHKDFNSLNNNPSNLEMMEWNAHKQLHIDAGTYSLGRQWNDPEARNKLVDGINRFHANISAEDKVKLAARNAKNGSTTFTDPVSRQRWLDSHAKAMRCVAESKYLTFTPEMFERLCEVFNSGSRSKLKICAALQNDHAFQAAYNAANNLISLSAAGATSRYVGLPTLDKTVHAGGYASWRDFKRTYKRNHKVVSVVWLSEREDTGDITVESASDSHVFAVSAGVYVHNSAEGRGSKVETLPGGELTGEVGDLLLFSRKLARGLRIPAAYLSLDDAEGGQAAYQDGKVSTALIQEFIFNKYCMRIQSLIAPVYDREFKKYLQKSGVDLEEDMFELQLCPPQNFSKYRQAEMDAQQVQIYTQLADNKKLSERFKLKRYLNMTEEEMIENERMWSEENADKLKKKTGATPADSNTIDDLNSVGAGGGGGSDFSFDAPPETEGDMGPDGAPLPDDGGDMGGAPPAAPSGGAPPPPSGGEPV